MQPTINTILGFSTPKVQSELSPGDVARAKTHDATR